MAYSIAVDSSAQRATISLSGTVSARTLYRALFDCVGRDAWMPGYDLVWDAHGIRKRISSAVAAEHLIQSATDLALLLGSGRTAVIAQSRFDTVVARRLLRRLPASSRQREVFVSTTAADRWLAVPVASGQQPAGVNRS